MSGPVLFMKRALEQIQCMRGGAVALNGLGTSDDARVTLGDVAAAHTLAGRDSDLVLGTRAAAASTDAVTRRAKIAEAVASSLIVDL